METQKDDMTGPKRHRQDPSLVSPFHVHPVQRAALGSDSGGFAQLISLPEPRCPHLKSGVPVMACLLTRTQAQDVQHVTCQTPHVRAVTVILRVMGS